MTKDAWVKINKQERTLLLDALAELRHEQVSNSRKIDKLAAKLVYAAPHPEITVGVHGGQVQWMIGNPFPIRVCDYDASGEEDLPDVDERGQRCRIWWEPASNCPARLR